MENEFKLTNQNPIYVIKVADYTTEIVCRYDDEQNDFYIQRGDGTILNRYSNDRVTFKKLLL